jgi:hypothetical protein
MRDEAPLIVYQSGPAFERLCPKCGRFMKFPDTLEYRQNWLSELCEFPKLDCSKCGPVQPVHVGWAGDFE